MISTAFYVLGVIACMILIVVAAIAAIVNFELIVGVLGLLLLLGFAWWLGLKQVLLVGAIIGIVAIILRLAKKGERKQALGETRLQRQRWAALDGCWKGDEP